MKLLLILFFSIISNFALAKTFATFNLVIANNTKSTFTAECIGSKGDDSVKFYYDSNWKYSKTELKTLNPGDKITFHAGTYTHRTINIPRIYSSAPYISDKSFFSLTLNKVSDDKDILCSVKTVWQGGNGDYDPEEHNTRFYYYRYTGSFVLKSSTSIDKKADFYLFGISHFGSKNYSDKYILTCDELWSKEAGYYMIEIQTSADKAGNKEKMELYSPGNNYPLTKGTG